MTNALGTNASPLASSFGLRHSFVIRHSEFVIPDSPFPAAAEILKYRSRFLGKALNKLRAGNA
jgi:hypothetical protein